jgi:hypothetical protein
LHVRFLPPLFTIFYKNYKHVAKGEEKIETENRYLNLNDERWLLTWTQHYWTELFASGTLKMKWGQQED